MSSQSDSVDKLKSQSVTNIFSNIIQVSSSLHLDKFSKSLELCSKASLQDVDSIFLDYFETFIQQLKEHLGNNSESSLETLSVLVQSLLDYLAILINSGSCDPSAVADAFLLSDIKGCLLLSCHLIDVSVSHVLSLIISQSLQHLANQIKSVWNLVIEFILKYIEVIEKYTTTGHSTILPLLSQVVLCLVKVAADIADVDTKVMVLLYKCIVSRILAKEVEYYRTENVINKVIKGVCQSTLTKLGSETAFQVTTESKVIGFLLRILGRLITFIVDVPDKCVDWSQVIEIIGGVSDSLCEVMYDHSESNSNLDLPLKSLITSCLPSAQFSCEIIKRAVTSGHRLSSLLYAICTVQECLAKCATVYAHWWAEPYLSQLLTFYTMCGNELCRPTTFNNRVQTCYEFVLARLSAMLVTMPSGDDFIRVEKLLFSLILSPAVHVNLLATDCWHFVARYSPGKLPYAHCCKLLDLLTHLKLSENQVCSVQSVLYRLVSLLSPAAQLDLVKRENAFYSGMLAQVPFKEEVQRELEIYSLPSLRSHLSQIRTKSCRPRHGILYSLEAVARLLCLSYQSKEGETVCRDAAKLLTETLIANLHKPSLSACICLTVNAFSSRRKHHSLLLKLLHAIQRIWATISVEVQKAAVSSLSTIATLPTNQDKDLTVSLYTLCLAGDQQYLRLHALQSFKVFAQTTAYQELINKVAAGSLAVKERVVQYCSMQVDGDYLTTQLTNIQPWNLQPFYSTLSLRNTHSKGGRCSSLEQLPPEKKPRMERDSNTLDKLRKVVDFINSAQLSESQWQSISHLTSELQRIVGEKPTTKLS